MHLRKQKTRYFGTKVLNRERYAVDFSNIAAEVIDQLVAAGAEVTVRLDIEATLPTGFDDAKVRTVSENSTTLKFEQSGFEES